MKTIAIIQSNYIPWKGYFDMIASVDEFILYDDMQFTKRDWRNRNKIKTPNGLQWLTVPVKVKGKYFQSINDTEIDGFEWQTAHWTALSLNYRKARFFREISDFIEPIYMQHRHTHISELNQQLINAICKYLGIRTKITRSSDYALVEGKTERLASLCIQAGGSRYLSGPAAKAYVDEGVFEAAGVTVTWMDYTDYPDYPQLWGGFDHQVTILDLLFNCGPDSGKFMRLLREPQHKPDYGVEE